MIRPLRSRHRVWIVALALAVPLLFVLGLRARREVPSNPSLPAALAAPTVDDADVLVSQIKQLPGASGVRIHRLRPAIPDGPQRLFVELTVDPHLPELLAYWSADAPVLGGGLPGDARLLGPLSPTVAAIYDLPSHASAPGTLVLYDLAHAEIVDAIALRPSGDAG